jgi:hypothetical protein
MENQLRKAAQFHSYKVDTDRMKAKVYQGINNRSVKSTWTLGKKTKIALATLALALPLTYASASGMWKHINIKIFDDINRSHQLTVFSTPFEKYPNYYEAITKQFKTYPYEEAVKLVTYPIKEVKAPESWKKEHSFAMKLGEDVHDLHYMDFFVNEKGDKVIVGQHLDTIFTQTAAGKEKVDGIPVPSDAEQLKLKEDFAYIDTVGKSYVLNGYHKEGKQGINIDIRSTEKESINYFAEQLLH